MIQAPKIQDGSLSPTGVVVLAVLAWSLGSCVPSPKPSFDSPAPNARLDAIVEAADATDPESLAALVAQLDSDDPAARLLASSALYKRTGQTLGYLSADPAWKRGPAVERWNEFIAPPIEEVPEEPSVD